MPSCSQLPWLCPVAHSCPGYAQLLTVALCLHRHYLCGCCFRSMRMSMRYSRGMSLSTGGGPNNQTTLTPNISLEDLVGGGFILNGGGKS